MILSVDLFQIKRSFKVSTPGTFSVPTYKGWQGVWGGNKQTPQIKTNWIHRSRGENKCILRWTKAGHTCQMHTQGLNTDKTTSHSTFHLLFEGNTGPHCCSASAKIPQLQPVLLHPARITPRPSKRFLCQAQYQKPHFSKIILGLE